MANSERRSARLELSVLSGRFAVCRLDAQSPIPAWADQGAFVSISRSDEALTVICPEYAVPAGIKREGDWVGLKLKGHLDFSLVGVLAALSSVLATANVPLLAVSTFDTEYILVQAVDLPKAVAALREAGHTVEE